ncbi:hypothetical protein [Ornithinimicrobium faecis]|nr:hypothetical protein [Ornithinimicrobium sp. HY1793]
MVEHVHRIAALEHDLVVERVNPPEAGVHMRLLVTLKGHLPG